MRADSTWLSRMRALARFEDRQGQSSHIERNRALTRSFCTHREVDCHKSLSDMPFCLLHVIRGRDTSVRSRGAMRAIFPIHVPWLLTGDA
jgi:hypothetical protein